MYNDFEKLPSFGVQYMSVTLISSLSNVFFLMVTLILPQFFHLTFICTFLSFQEPLLFQQLHSCRCIPSYPQLEDLETSNGFTYVQGQNQFFILGYQRLHGLEEAKAKLLCPKCPTFLPKLKVKELFLSYTFQCQDIFQTN